MCHERWALHVVIKRKVFLHLCNTVVTISLQYYYLLTMCVSHCEANRGVRILLGNQNIVKISLYYGKPWSQNPLFVSEFQRGVKLLSFMRIGTKITEECRKQSQACAIIEISDGASWRKNLLLSKGTLLGRPT